MFVVWGGFTLGDGSLGWVVLELGGDGGGDLGKAWVLFGEGGFLRFCVCNCVMFIWGNCRRLECLLADPA